MNNNIEEGMIRCSRCGAEMKASARYCMKCGNLNYNHPDNQNMQKLLNKEQRQQEQVQTYTVGSGPNYFKPETEVTATGIMARSTTGNKKAFYIINILLLILLYAIVILPPVLDKSLSLDMQISKLSLPVTLISVLALYFLSLELLFMKANKQWWKALIPIYNIGIFTEIATGKFWLMLLQFIPGVNVIFTFYLLYKIGEKFDQSPILTLIFPIIFIPLIAFGSSLYQKTSYLESNNSKEIERDYRIRKAIAIFLFLFMFSGIGGIIYINLNGITKIYDDVQSGNLIKEAQNIISTTNDAILAEKIFCNDTTSTIPVGQSRYFSYTVDDEEDLKAFALSENFQAIIQVNHTTDTTYEYIISYTNGRKGFLNIRENDLNEDAITDVTSLEQVTFPSDYQCYLS